jgi:type IV pilus assembly protein PilM
MVLAVPKNIISTYMEVLAGAGLKLKYIDVDVNALSKLIKKSIYSHLSNSSETASCLIDFGSATTKVTVFQNAIYCIHKTIPKGSAQITDIITNQMQTDFSTAEEIKMQKNFIDFPGKKWNNKDVISFLNELTAEIFRVIQYYNNNNRFNNIDHIYLLGGGAHLKGLSKFLEEHLGIKVSIIDDLMPFSMIPPASSKKLKIPFTTLSYAIAVTLREEP